ncbi:MAG: ABC transporter ATP-binding protein [Lachnospiraceae bacterium]|nr:ABC transporter ATP-binding protein [Lachnospiraceae bacterium]
MQSMNAIEVRDVTKIYRLYNKPSDRLLETLCPKKSRHRDFYALNGVSFNVEKGTTVGVIGTNGSGKSTILKIITGVLTPSAGEVKVNGTVSALLELGAGFNMEYTGLENIYMNGTMMGFTRQQMEEKLPEILAFADIGEFVDQPVKSYSSGMFVRLAFALAINVEPDILIVDEALSVGDVFFQAKCYHKMEEIRKRGTTIVMVTHDMSSIIKYCDKVVLLNRGDKLAEGEPGKMVDLYKKILVGLDPVEDEPVKSEGNHSGQLRWLDSLEENPGHMNYGDGSASIVDVGIFDEQGRLTNQIFKGSELTIRTKVQFAKPVDMPIFSFTFKDKKGTELTGTNTMYEKIQVTPAKSGDVYEVSFRQRMTLQGGEYLLSVGCTGFESGEFVVYNRLYDIVNIVVISAKNTVGVYDMESDVTVTKELRS